jgi:hypothetical protein
MAKDYGLYDHRVLLIAHLLRECGSMTEFCDWKPGKATNDDGWAFGIAQWHLCYREWDWLYSKGWAYYDSAGVKQCRWNVDITKVRDAYFSEHPEMTDWRKQAERYLREISGGITRYGTVTAVVDSWNSNPAYMKHVYAQKPLAHSLLSL